MEQNLPIITKKFYNTVKLAIFMSRKGLSKKKLLLDLNLMMKRGKKTFTIGKVSTTQRGVIGFKPQQEYEFSCKNTPLYRHYFTNKKKDSQNYYYTPSPSFKDIDESEAIKKVLEAIVSCKDSGVQPLRVTDSPFPSHNEEHYYGDECVDDAAEEFIQRFYSQLKEQSCC